MELAVDREGQTAGGPERDAPIEGALTRDRGRTKTAKGDEQIPRTSPARARCEERATGQAARTSPGAGPERALSEEHQARMTRTGGVSTGATDERRAERKEFDQTAETRGTKTARAMRRTTAWVPRPVANQRRSGMVRRPAAPGRHGAASERRRDASETAGETPRSICPAPRRRRAANRPGR